MNLNKISISGSVGSGKSSVAKIVSQKLGYKYHSIGEFMRKIAHQKNIHLSDLSKIAERDKSIDYQLDDMQKQLNNQQDFVMDSRLGFYFIPSSYKVFLKVPVNVAASRIFKDKRKNESYSNLEETKNHLRRRMQSEKLRYKQCYGIDFPNESDFDLVIDTTNMGKEQVAEEIIMGFKEKG